MKLWHYILIFTVFLAIFIIILFPTDELVKNLCYRFKEQTGMELSYANAGVSAFSIVLQNIKINKDKEDVADFNKLWLSLTLNGLKIRVKKDSGGAIIESKGNKIICGITNLTIPEFLKDSLGVGIVNNMTGEYKKKEKEGSGLYSISLKELPRLSIKEDLSIEGKYTLAEGNLNLTFSLKGRLLKGAGLINIILQKNIWDSIVSGSIDASPARFTLGGTLGDIQTKLSAGNTGFE